MKPVALHVFIEGMVQGVGFRQAAARKARTLNLTGWVQNLPDGRVEAWFEGRNSELDEMLEWCRRGPALAEVRQVDSSRQPATGAHPGFEIKF